MARYTILSRMRVMPKPLAIGSAETPAEAVRIAREAAKQGRPDIQIGDNQAATYVSAEEFAAQHGIR